MKDDKSVYTVILDSDTGVRVKLTMVSAAMPSADYPTLPNATFLPGSSYSLDLANCALVSNGASQTPADGFCTVSVSAGKSSLIGHLVDDAGQTTRFSLTQAIFFNQDENASYYKHMTGKWDASCDTWYTYDSEDKTWKYSNTGSPSFINLIGFTVYDKLVANDFQSESFQFIIDRDEEGL